MRLYDIYLKHPSIQTDSRKVQPGDLFFALKGPKFNGNEYAANAIEKGAAFAVVDEAKYAVSNQYILEEDVLESLQQLARFHRVLFNNVPFLAITGSNGKTTTKELIHAVLSKKYKAYATEGNLNNHIGIPLTLLKIKSDAQLAIIEMGANHQKEIELYCGISLPTFGLITNCGKAHLEGFGGEEGVRKGKGELYDFLRKHGGTIFRNTDEAYLKNMALGIEDQILYGSSNAKILGKAIHDGPFLNVALLTTGMETTIRTQLIGDYNLANVLAAVAVGNYFDVDISDIQNAIESYTPSNSRSQLLTKGDNQIILDAYNANPSSMQLALENFSKIQADQKWVLLGGMKELGENSSQEHQSIAVILERFGFQNVYLVGPEFETVKHTFQWFPDSEALKDYLLDHPIHHASVLIKGSRGAAMEKTLEAF